MVGKDGDLLDELFYQSFVELCNVGFLYGDEVLQFLDSVHDFFPAVAVELGLFLLQLVESGLDTVRAHRVGGCYRFCDVLLHLSDEAVLVVEYLIERLGCDFLQEFFLDGSAGAAFSFRKM